MIQDVRDILRFNSNSMCNIKEVFHTMQSVPRVLWLRLHTVTGPATVSDVIDGESSILGRFKSYRSTTYAYVGT